MLVCCLLHDCWCLNSLCITMQTSLWNSLYPNQIIGAPLVVKEFDCLTATLEEVSSVRSAFRYPLDPGHSKLCGFAGWFDVHFKVWSLHLLWLTCLYQNSLSDASCNTIWLLVLEPGYGVNTVAVVYASVGLGSELECCATWCTGMPKWSCWPRGGVNHCPKCWRHHTLGPAGNISQVPILDGFSISKM